MTDEAHGDTPEEALAPPTSTRWSEDAVAEDDAPPPPFAPGRQPPPAEATPGAEAATGERTSDGGAQPAAAEAFPFELPVDRDEPGAAQEDEAVEAAAAGEAAAATDAVEDDFPFEQFNIEGRGEGAGTPGPDRGDPAVPAHAAASDPSAPFAADSIEETATLLDRLADVLRSEGEAGVRRELDSPDRLTAVLAGILAGYLSGRS